MAAAQWSAAPVHIRAHAGGRIAHANGGEAMTEHQDLSSGRETTIVENEVYNVIATLANKLEALAAYDKYAQDGQANDQLWQQLRQQDQQAVRHLMQQLAHFAEQGKLTAK
jgi:hypothetical protein